MTSLGLKEGLLVMEARFQWFMDNLHDVLVLLDGRGDILQQSPSIERVFGYHVNEVVGRTGWDFVHPDDVPALRETFLRGLQNPGETIRHEYRFRHRDGSWRQVETVGVNMLDVPPVSAVVAITRDVTERHRAAEALRRSEERFHTAFDHATVGMAILSPLGRILEANRALHGILGREGGALRHESLAAFAFPGEAERQEAVYRGFLTGETDAAQAEWHMRRGDGGVLWLEVSLSLQRDASGAPLHVVLVAQDVTARRKAAEMEQRLAAVVQAADDAIFGTDVEGIVTSWNPAAERMLGYRADEIVGRSVLTVVPAALHDEARGRLRRLALGEGFADKAIDHVAKSGERVRSMMWLSPIRGPTGEVSGSCAIVRRAR